MLFIFIQKKRAQKCSSKCPTSPFKNSISIPSLQLIDASTTQLIGRGMMPFFWKWVPLIFLFNHIYYERMYRHNHPQGMSSPSMWLWSIWWTLLNPITRGDQGPTVLNSLEAHVYWHAILATIMQMVFWFKSQLCHSFHYVTQFPLRWYVRFNKVTHQMQSET